MALRALKSPLTYSPSLTVPLTHDCPWNCAYCGYRSDRGGLISQAEVDRLFQIAKTQGVKEILFISGEIPNSQPHLQKQLTDRAYANFLEFAVDLAQQAMDHGFYPHSNFGALTSRQLEALRHVNFSMGLMLENIDDTFNRTVAPQKSVRGRLRTIESAGRLKIPYTSGILIGLGESHDSRRLSLKALAELHNRFGHLQEIIIQNYIPNAASRWPQQPVTLEEYLELISDWRKLAPDVAIQIPPNINPHWEFLLPYINDLGGISPLGDLVNPQNPWAQVEHYSAAARRVGRDLVERWPIYDEFIHPDWVAPQLLPRLRLPSRPQRSIWDWPTDELRSAASELNEKLHGRRVTYVVNRNANFTNICNIGCSFCGFQKKASSPEAYARTPDQIIARLQESPEITEVCMQGGINPAYGFADYLHLVRSIRQWRPDLHIHAFSPMEIESMHLKSGLSYEHILTELQAAGLNSIPGTAAEILNDEVRQQIASRKLGTTTWIEIIRTAHRVGLRSTATIMFGHLETWEQIRAHLETLLKIQEETGGFTEFIPLQFVPHENPLGHRIRPDHARVEEIRLRLYALARLFFGSTLPHLQTSWVKLGVTGAAELLDLCDDFGGTLYEESITRSSGGQHGEYLSPSDIQTAIRSVGKEPVQRTTFYQPIALAY